MKSPYPDTFEFSGKTYKVIAEDSGGVAPNIDEVTKISNAKHAEQKLMSYLQDAYSGKAANISIGVENTSSSKSGMRSGCSVTSRTFARGNPLFDIKFFEGSTMVNP